MLILDQVSFFRKLLLIISFQQSEQIKPSFMVIKDEGLCFLNTLLNLTDVISPKNIVTRKFGPTCSII